MTSYIGWAMAEFLRTIETRTTTELLHMIEGGDDRLTIAQRRAIRAEIKSREI
jgi:hypothetical protein